MDKIGLKYDYRNNCIDVSDQVKWEKTSMIYRISFKMPSTTNSLESYHGHLNKLTPRKNNFFTALCRIATNLNQHNQNYLKRIKHNINYTISSTKKQIEKKDSSRMQKEQLFYKTTKESCHCSSNKLVSAQMGFNIPCLHQLALSDPPSIPKLPKIVLKIDDQWNKLIDDYKPIEEKKSTKKRNDDDKSYLINTIKFYSKYKEKEIDDFIEKIYNEMPHDTNEFIMNKPAYFIEIIDKGIDFGLKLKNIKKENQKKNKIK